MPRSAGIPLRFSRAIFIAGALFSALFLFSPARAAESAVRTHTLTIGATNGSVSATPALKSYADGSTLTLQPTANAGYFFTHWSGALPSRYDSAHPVGTLSLTMDRSRSLTAHFSKDPRFPDPPENISAHVNRHGVNLLWDFHESPGVVGYHAYARPEGSRVWERQSETLIDDNLFTHRPAQRDVVYEYDITAVTTQGLESRHPIHNDTTLQALLDQLSERAPTRVGIYVRHLDLDEEAGVRANERFPAMSAIKAALSVHAFDRDRLKPGTLATTLTLTKANQVEGSGRLKRAEPGLAFKQIDLIRLMLLDSDNTAANMMVDAMGGVVRINAELAKLGFPNLMILKKACYPDDGKLYTELREKYSFSIITPREQGTLFYKLGQGKLIDPTRDKMILDILFKGKRGSRLRRDLSLFSEIKVANKTGSSNHNRLDSGLVWTPDRGEWVIVVALSDYPKVSWETPHPLDSYIAEVSWQVYLYFGDCYGVTTVF